MPGLGRSFADWDRGTWDALRDVFTSTWAMPAREAELVGRSFYFAGELLGALASRGPLLSHELTDAAEGIADVSRYGVLRDFVRDAVTTTGGDREGLSDLAMAMRDAGKAIGMHARQELRGGVTAEHAFLNAQAQMLGLSRMSVEEALGDRPAQ